MRIEVDSDAFANSLKWYMSRASITQTDFAKRLGISKSTVSDWCHGKKLPGNAGMFYKIADVLGIEVADLWENSEVREDRSRARSLASYSVLLEEREDLRECMELLRKVSPADMPRVIEMIKIFAEVKA